MSVTTVSLATAVALSAAGWLPTGARWDQNRWPVVPYCISANANASNGVTPTQQRQAVLGAIASWVSTGAGGALSCTTYQAAPASYPCSIGVDGGDQEFNISWVSNWTNGSQAIGVTWSTGNGRSCGSVTDDTGRNHNLGCKYDSDIEFNDANYNWSINGSATDIESIALHEYGHLIGLDHCSDNNTCGAGSGVMNAFYPGGRIRTLFNDDVQGGCGLYPGTQGGFAWPCSGDAQCNSGVCAAASTDGYCSQACGTCPTGFLCDTDPSNAGRTVCLRDDGLNKAVCQTCQAGVPGACRDNGICMSGLPDNRCIVPCGAGGTCGNQYQCLTVQFQGGGTGDYCFPRSSNCDDLNNFTVLQMGQQCNGAVACDVGLECVGICAQSCDNQACPQGWGCERFTSGSSYCLPSVAEGQSCEGLKSCGTGPCLTNPANQVATCYQDCEGNPGACNNAQACNTYNLSGGGGQVSICEPPGVPPNPPDAGVIFEDSGVVNPGPDGSVTPRDSGVSTTPRDGGVPAPFDAGLTPGVCGCDLTYSCDLQTSGLGECGCDPECLCACDLTYACDPGCGLCDPECQSATCSCRSTDSAGGPSSAWFGLALVALVLMRRRR